MGVERKNGRWINALEERIILHCQQRWTLQAISGTVKSIYMIPQTSSELLKNINLVTDQNLHAKAFEEYKKLKAKDKSSKFKLKRIYHENGSHIYVWQSGSYFAVLESQGINDVWSLNEIMKLEQIKMPL